MTITYAFEILNFVESYDSENNINYVSSINWRYRGANENNVTSYVDGTNYYTEQQSYTSTTNNDLINIVTISNNINILQNKIKINIYNIVYPRTYKWIIYSLSVMPNFEGYGNFVASVNWRYNAKSEQGFVANIEGQSNFNKQGGQYVTYENLTENDVISWIEATENTDILKEKLDTIINEQINPVIVNLPLPW
jgi:hypothetical protein